MKLNKYGLPILDSDKSVRKKKPVCPFNFQGNKALAFLAVQAYRNERRLDEVIAERKTKEEEIAKKGGLW
jgi:hypothetical protein